MKTSNNFCFYVLITCMLLFVNQKVVGVKYNFKRGVPLVTENEDGTIELNIERGEELGYFNLCMESDESLIESMMQDWKEAHSLHGYGSKLGKMKFIKEWIPTEDEIKRIMKSFFSNEKYLGLSMQETDNDDQEPVKKPVTESKQSINETLSTLGNFLNNKRLFKQKRSFNSGQEAPKSSETESQRSNIEIKQLLRNTLNNNRRSYFKLPKKKVSKNRVQEASKTEDLKNSSREAPETSDQKASEPSALEATETSDQKASESSAPDASESNAPEDLESSAPEASETSDQKASESSALYVKLNSIPALAYNFAMLMAQQRRGGWFN